jgi:hypothetical protein
MKRGGCHEREEIINCDQMNRKFFEFSFIIHGTLILYTNFDKIDCGKHLLLLLFQITEYFYNFLAMKVS